MADKCKNVDMNDEKEKIVDKKEKTDIREELISIFTIIKNGGSLDIKQANKRLDNLIKERRGNLIFYKIIEPIILREIENFDLIKNSKNQSALISSLRLFIDSIAQANYKIIRDFFFKIIQHPNGHVRTSAERAFLELNFYFDAILDHQPFFKSKKPTDEDLKIAEKRYIEIVQDLSILISKNDTNEDVDYIDEMKPSIAKNLNNVWRWYASYGLYGKIIEKRRPVPLKIVEMRMAVTRRLEDLLKRSKSMYDLNDIKRIIFEEEDGNEDIMQLISMFDTGEKGGASFDEIIDVVNIAWNCFPHISLEGASPIESSDEESIYN